MHRTVDVRRFRDEGLGYDRPSTEPLDELIQIIQQVGQTQPQLPAARHSSDTPMTGAMAMSAKKRRWRLRSSTDGSTMR